MIFRDEHLRLIGKLMAENISFEVDSYGTIPLDKITINDTCDITVWYYGDEEVAKEGYFEIDHITAINRDSFVRKSANDVITLLSRIL